MLVQYILQLNGRNLEDITRTYGKTLAETQEGLILNTYYLHLQTHCQVVRVLYKYCITIRKSYNLKLIP